MKDLRISVTDRCNFRCRYCMPLEKYEWIDRREILTFEEITRLAKLFIELGVEEIRITGGEPLLRHGLETLVAQLANLEGLRDLSLTTNASLLEDMAPGLSRAGLKRINVSLDTIDPEKFRHMTRRDDLPNVLSGLYAAARHGLNPIKINSVIERGINNDDILNLVEFSRKNGFWIRFIEYMDVGNSNNWVSERMVSKREILDTIHSGFPLKEVGRKRAGGRLPVSRRHRPCRRDRVGHRTFLPRMHARPPHRRRQTGDVPVFRPGPRPQEAVERGRWR
jgi:cyclic pyranopterin phosphate synthase